MHPLAKATSQANAFAEKEVLVSSLLVKDAVNSIAAATKKSEKDSQTPLNENLLDENNDSVTSTVQVEEHCTDDNTNDSVTSSQVECNGVTDLVVTKKDSRTRRFARWVRQKLSSSHNTPDQFQELKDALEVIQDAEERSVEQVIVKATRRNRTLTQFLRKMVQHKYLKEIHSNKHQIFVQLNGRIKKCGVYPSRVKVSSNYLLDMEVWEEGYIVFTTPSGVKTHEELKSRKLGGTIIGRFY